MLLGDKMKKLNKKGFTLIELLAVIVILVVIMAIAIPNVSSSIERSKQKQKNQKIELIVSAGEIYYDFHKNTIKNNDKIYLKNLISDGLVTKEEIKDPFHESRSLCGYILYTNNYGIQWKEQSLEQCSGDYIVSM